MFCSKRSYSIIYYLSVRPSVRNDILWFSRLLFKIEGSIFKILKNNNIKIKYLVVLRIQYVIYFDCQFVNDHTKYKYLREVSWFFLSENLLLISTNFPEISLSVFLSIINLCFATFECCHPCLNSIKFKDFYIYSMSRVSTKKSIYLEVCLILVKATYKNVFV